MRYTLWKSIRRLFRIRGNEYNTRGENQLAGYLADYGLDQGYMLSFCFNKKKQIGVHEVIAKGKVIIEAVV